VEREWAEVGAGGRLESPDRGERMGGGVGVVPVGAMGMELGRGMAVVGRTEAAEAAEA